MAAKKNADDLSTPFRQMSVSAEDINILLLGETGIGKSTFINAFTNYLHYKTLDTAEKSDVKCLVPAKFEITNEEKGQFVKKVISIGEDTNENTSITSAATQTARSYVFPLPDYNSRNFRLIDTPGICDDRGIEQDKENLENILSYIGAIEHLHAICILLKPNNARLTVPFQYCVTQLLSRLEKSAGNNIIFVFTNSRSTFYRPGDSSAAVTKILDLIAKHPPYVKIKFEKENIFCLDNESFRYLAATKQKVNIANKSSFVESWQHSVQECHRLIKYVIGDGPTKIAPHLVSKTISVNKARQVIIELSKPLADITDHINDNVEALQRHQKALQVDYSSIETLKTKLYVPVVNLRLIECSQPKTVCANVQCCDTVAVGGKSKLHYKQKCHNPCYLTNIPKEIIGDKGLVNCAAMDRSGQCKECGCNFSAHMHIYYETETFDDKIEGSGIKAQIADRESAVNATKKIIRDIEVAKNQFEGEKNTIVKAMAKFAHFLEHNAISPFNDSYKAYIEYLIKRESSRGPDCSVQTVQNLETLLKQYDEEKKILEDALTMRSNENPINNITPNMILTQIKQLYALPRTGQIIKSMHNLQKQGKASEHKNTEYVLSKVDVYDSDHSSSSFGSNRGRNNRGRNRGRGKQRGNNRMNMVHEENKFKNNKKGGPQNQTQNEKFKREIQNNLPNYQKQNNQANPQDYRRNEQRQRDFSQYGNRKNAAGNYNPHFQNQPYMQQPPPYYPPNYYQGNPLNVQNPQFNMPPSLLSMPYQNPNVGQYQGQWNPHHSQPFQGYHGAYPPQNMSQNVPQNNGANQPPNYNSIAQQNNYRRNENFVQNKLGGDEYEELYGQKDEAKSTPNQSKNYYTKDSDSDNESSNSFEKFRKQKGLDRKRCNYEDLYGDHDDEDDGRSPQKSLGGIFSSMKGLFK